MTCLKIWICEVDLSFPDAFLRATNSIRSRRKLAQIYSILQNRLVKGKKNQAKIVGKPQIIFNKYYFQSTFRPTDLQTVWLRFLDNLFCERPGEFARHYVLLDHLKRV